MAQDSTNSEPFKAVIVGAGVAGIEAALTLQELAGDRVATTLLSPTTEFVYRPMSVREPFARSGAAHYPLAELAAAAGAEHRRDALRWLEPATRTVHTSAGEQIRYDAVLLALGARVYARYQRATTIDPARIDAQLHGIVQDIEEGWLDSLAFVIPAGRFWPLPAYELALMTAGRAYAMGVSPRITLVTPEPAPLAMFGETASAAVAARLAGTGVELITGADATVRANGRVTIRGRAGDLLAKRVVALPELLGPAVAGVPASALHGFIATDPHGRVRDLDRVYAAGDITDYPVKQGAIAAQQATCAAQEIAGLAGAAIAAEPFEPIVHGVLLGPGKPLYLRARLVGGRPVSSEASETPLWESGDKIHAPRLTRLLAGYGQQPGPSTTALAPS